MSYNPDAMTIIVSGDLPNEMADKLRNQVTADIVTVAEMNERENALTMSEEVAEETEQNRVDAGLEEPADEGDGFAAPDETQVDNVDMADTSGESADSSLDDGLETGADGATNEEDADADAVDDPDAVSTEENNESDNAEDDGVDENGAAKVDEEDLEDVSEEDAAVEDELSEPNAAFEHAESIGSRELGIYLRLGNDKYRRRVRRLKKEKDLKLAQETLQMDDAMRQKLVRRLLYVKPAESGFNSKLQTFISTITNPDDWIALVDIDGNSSSDDDLSTKQIQEALRKAGIQMFDNVETLADTFNQVQKAVTEPSDAVNQDGGGDVY